MHLLAAGSADVAGGKRDDAVTEVRDAETALTEAAALLDAVDATRTSIEELGAKIGAEIAAIQQDIAQAQAAVASGKGAEHQAAVESAAGLIAQAQQAMAAAPPDVMAASRLATEANGIVALEPFTSNLAYPADNLVRMEIALAFNGQPDLVIAEEIHQDIMAYMRTVSLQQIQGPRGFQYLRDDLKERVDLRSEGRVTNFMFRTFVIE